MTTAQEPDLICTCNEETREQLVHSCPFEVEINGDKKNYCNCCEACIYDCEMKI